MSEQYAPIVLFVYNRLEHTKSTVEYLKKNSLAKSSELFIYSDAAKNEQQKEKVQLVREYIHTITGFKKVKIVKAKQNKGLARSIIDGVSEIIEQYGKVIVLEDDLLTAPCFLQYMNDALSFYEEEKRIWSITGYQYPFDIPSDYKYSIYLSYRGSSWSWGTWRDRWETVDWNVSDFNQYKYSIRRIAHFCKGGTDLDKLIREQMRGNIDSWAIRWCYSQSFQNKYTVYPCKSLIENSGTDGSGTHFSQASNRFQTKMVSNYVYKFSHMLKIDSAIMHRYRKIVNRSIVRKIKRLIEKVIK